MAGLVLNKSISLMLFQGKSYELLHVISLAFLYILLTYFLKFNVLNGRKLRRISLLIIRTTHIYIPITL